jgi:catechol 2,3-dioxygenase-like lactoylglutathione lyase family enzyme
MTRIPPVQRFDHWTLVSSDLDRTKRFYTEVLGAAIPERANGPASVTFANTIIDFFPAGDGRQPSPGSTSQHHAYIIDVADYDAWVEHLRANDVKLRQTTHALEGISIFFDDPDGYHIELSAPLGSEDEARREIEKRGLTRT